MKVAYVSNAAVEESSDFMLSEDGKTMQDNLWVSVSWLGFRSPCD